MRRSAGDPNHKLAMDNTLDQWLEVSVNAHNRMTQFISGILNQVPTPEVFELAKHNLRKFAFVGLNERWAESVELMAVMFGWKRSLPYGDNDVDAYSSRRAGVTRRLTCTLLWNRDAERTDRA